MYRPIVFDENTENRRVKATTKFYETGINEFEGKVWDRPGYFDKLIFDLFRT